MYVNFQIVISLFTLAKNKITYYSFYEFLELMLG